MDLRFYTFAQAAHVDKKGVQFLYLKDSFLKYDNVRDIYYIIALVFKLTMIVMQGLEGWGRVCTFG